MTTNVKITHEGPNNRLAKISVLADGKDNEDFSVLKEGESIKFNLFDTQSLLITEGEPIVPSGSGTDTGRFVPFAASDLSVLAYANNFTLWHYITKSGSIPASGYFDNAADSLRINDLIIINADTVGNPGTDLMIVTKNDGVTVTIAPIND